MRRIALLILLLAGTFAYGQDAVPAPKMHTAPKADTIHHSRFVKKSTIFSLGLGFLDAYRYNYSYPAGYEKKTIAGFPSVAARLEYAVSNRVSIGAALMYDGFTNNYYQLIESNGNSYKRVITDDAHVFSGSVAAYYHLGDVSATSHWDPYVGVGVSVNNYSQTAYPQGDSTITHTEHPVTAFAKVGTRYLITDKGSLYAEAGYDKTSIFNIGFSLRFFKK